MFIKLAEECNVNVLIKYGQFIVCVSFFLGHS